MSIKRLLGRRGCVISLLACVLGVGMASAFVHWLDLPPDPLEPADAIVVLGGEHPARILTGAYLYRQGIATEIWITGDVPPEGQEVSLAEAAGLVAWRNGVPYEQQHLLATTSTWEDGEQILAMIHKHETQHVRIVTSWYHSRRAMCVIRHQLAGQKVRVSYTPSEGTQPSSSWWWLSLNGWSTITHEFLAFGYYWPQYGLQPWTC